MKFMFLLVALSCAVLTQCHPSLDGLPKHPGGIGGLFRGPNSETIIRGPDGSEITAADEAGHITTGGALQTIIAAEPVPIQTAPALPIISETIETHTVAVQPVVAQAVAVNTAIPVVDVTKPVDIHLVDAPEVEPNQSSDLHGPSGSITTRGSKSVVSGPASTTIHEPVHKIPLVAAAVPIVAHAEIRTAPLLETASIQPTISHQTINIEQASPIVQPASLNGLIGNEISTIAPGLQEQTLLSNNIQQQTVLTNNIAATAAPSQLNFEADIPRQLTSESVIQQTEAEAIARSQQIAAATQRQRQQGEAEALLRSQQIAAAGRQRQQSEGEALLRSQHIAAAERQRQQDESEALLRSQQLAAAERERQIAAQQGIQQTEANAIARSQQIAAQSAPQQATTQQSAAPAAAQQDQQQGGDSAAALEEKRRVAEQVANQRNRQLAEEAGQIEAARQRAENEAAERNRQLSAQAAEVEQARLAAEAEAQARIKALSEAAALEDSRQRAEAEEIERSRQLLEVAAKEDSRRRQVEAEAQAQAQARAQAQAQAEAEAQTQAQAQAQRQSQAQASQARNNVAGIKQTPGLSIATTIRNPASENDLRLLEEQRRQQLLAIEAQAQIQGQRQQSLQQQSLQNALNQGQIGLNPALIPANNIIPPGVGYNRGLVSSTIAPETLGDNSLRVDGRQLEISQLQLQNQIPIAPPGLDGRTLNAEDSILHSELTKLNIDPSQIQLSNVPLSQVQGLQGGQWGRYGRQLKKKKN